MDNAIYKLKTALLTAIRPTFDKNAELFVH